MSTHARFSMSKLPRILECPGSVPLIEEYLKEIGTQEERQSKDASKGTFLHSIMADHLTRDDFRVTEVLHEDKTTNIDYVNAVESLLAWVFAQKAIYGDDYVDFVETVVSLKGFIEFTQNDLLEEVEGTGDYAFITGKTLYVCDWKFGNIQVNPSSHQLLGYAAGFLKNPEHANRFNKVVTVIGQPTGQEVIKMEEYSRDEIIRWIKHTLSPGLRKTKANPPILNPSEGACRFCMVKSRCSARKDMAYRIAQDVFKIHAQLPNLLSVDELAKVMNDFEFLDQYIRDLSSYAFKYISTGRSIPGYKVVSGRSQRVWKDEKHAVKVLATMGFEPEDLSEIKFYGPAKVEKVIGKALAKTESFLNLVTKSEPSLTLTKESDKRPAINFLTADQVFADFVEED